MELSEEELYQIERSRVIKTLQSKEEAVELQALVDEYNEKFKPDLKMWKSRFVTIEAFLKIGCGVEISGTGVTLASNANSTISTSASPQSSMVRYLTRPQFSSFFGFSDERGKGVVYRVWRFEVESAIRENLHSHEVIAVFACKAKQKPKSLALGPARR